MKLSIITINYNNCAGLQKTIDSVVAQTWRDFEWIVIDGGSTDGSKELIERYQEYFAYWCSEPDKGVYNAMNKGIAKAQGEYLIFMNSGDCFVDESTLKEVFLLNFVEDIVSGQVIRNDDGLLLREYDNNIVKQIVLRTLNHQGTFIKRTLFQYYSYNEDYRIISDWIAWIEWIIKSNCSYRIIDEVIAVQDMQGISNIQMEAMANEKKIAMKELFGERLATELLQLYRANDRLKKELNIPAISGIRYILNISPVLFSLFQKFILLILKFLDLFLKKSFSDFRKNDNIMMSK